MVTLSVVSIHVCMTCVYIEGRANMNVLNGIPKFPEKYQSIFLLYDDDSDSDEGSEDTQQKQQQCKSEGSEKKGKREREEFVTRDEVVWVMRRVTRALSDTTQLQHLGIHIHYIYPYSSISLSPYLLLYLYIGGY